MSRTAGLKRHVPLLLLLLLFVQSLCIATTHHHYISPLHIATTTVTSHIGKKRPKTRNMTTLKGLVRFLFFIFTNNTAVFTSSQKTFAQLVLCSPVCQKSNPTPFVIHTFHGNNDRCKAVYDVCVVQPLSEFLFFIICLILLIY